MARTRDKVADAFWERLGSLPEAKSELVDSYIRDPKTGKVDVKKEFKTVYVDREAFLREFRKEVIHQYQQHYNELKQTYPGILPPPDTKIIDQFVKLEKFLDRHYEEEVRGLIDKHNRGDNHPDLRLEGLEARHKIKEAKLNADLAETKAKFDASKAALTSEELQILHELNTWDKLSNTILSKNIFRTGDATVVSTMRTAEFVRDYGPYDRFLPHVLKELGPELIKPAQLAPAQQSPGPGPVPREDKKAQQHPPAAAIGPAPAAVEANNSRPSGITSPATLFGKPAAEAKAKPMVDAKVLKELEIRQNIPLQSTGWAEVMLKKLTETFDQLESKETRLNEKEIYAQGFRDLSNAIDSINPLPHLNLIRTMIELYEKNLLKFIDKHGTKKLSDLTEVDYQKFANEKFAPGTFKDRYNHFDRMLGLTLQKIAADPYGSALIAHCFKNRDNAKQYFLNTVRTIPVPKNEWGPGKQLGDTYEAMMRLDALPKIDDVQSTINTLTSSPAPPHLNQDRDKVFKKS